MTILNDERQRIVMDAACNQAVMAYQEISAALTAPDVVYKVIPVPDGNQWMCLLGENLQEGIAGFGDTPDAAVRAFNTAWWTQKTPAAMLAEQEPTDD